MNEQFLISGDAGQRAIADAIENRVVKRYVELGGKAPKSVRTIEDVTFHNKLIDIKTRDVNRKFSMPNLISVDRLLKNRDKNIWFEFIDYKTRINSLGKATVVEIVGKKYVPIWKIDWESLSIQNLGKGQLQLSKIEFDEYKKTKEEWFGQLERETLAFYQKQQKKFQKYHENLIKNIQKPLDNDDKYSIIESYETLTTGENMDKSKKQMDLYEPEKFYYDLDKDLAKLGTWRDFLKEGDTFLWDAETWVIEETRPIDQTWLVSRKKDGGIFGD